MADTTFEGTPEEFYQRMAMLPAALAGQVPGLRREAEAVTKAMAIELLACVREAAIEKGRGQTGSDGIRWAPLSARYLAYGRRHKGLQQKKSRAARAGRAARPLLTAAQDQLWRRVFARCVAAGDDKATAAMKAWGAAKRAGGKTIIGQYGGAQVQIGANTGRMLASLSPGAQGNVLDVRPGRIRTGSNVVYVPHFHEKRPLWPHSGSLPQAWGERLESIFLAALPAFINKLLAK